MTEIENAILEVTSFSRLLQLGFVGIGWIGRNRLEAIANSGLAKIAAVHDPYVRTLENIKGILEGAGSNLHHVVKTTVFLKDINDFAAMNEVYGKYFNQAPPARSTVQVARLPKDALVEIEVIAAS